jgi:hypothetical protein
MSYSYIIIVDLSLSMFQLSPNSNTWMSWARRRLIGRMRKDVTHRVHGCRREEHNELLCRITTTDGLQWCCKATDHVRKFQLTCSLAQTLLCWVHSKIDCKDIFCTYIKFCVWNWRYHKCYPGQEPNSCIGPWGWTQP